MKRQRYPLPTDLGVFTLSLSVTPEDLAVTGTSVKGAPAAWFTYSTRMHTVALSEESDAGKTSAVYQNGHFLF